MIDKLGLDGLGGASVRVEPAVVGLESVAFMTHHDEPMLFPTWDEAVQYCDDDESPISLFHADDVAKLQADLATMTQERDELREWNKAMVVKAASGGVLDGYREMGKQLAASQAENEALRKDADRYRWLRDNDWLTEGLLKIFWSHEEFEQLIGDELDAAIDAAMKG